MHIEQLGPYRIGKKLGRGGMGTVYAGQNIETGELAAIKILSPSLAHEEGFRERFGAEIETLRKLRHPHIVRLLGFGEQDGHYFYAMDLVDGTSLEEELRAGRRFDWREVSQIAIQVCQALKHAHDRGVIHRDIKPANLLLSADGNVKLSDFGIAKLFGNTGMTADGVLGTAEYMAPEQADGRPVSHRCDLYSLGGVMYALLAGRPPFRAKSLPEMLHMQRFAEPEPVRRYAADVPADLEQVISQLLSKEPDSRLANAQVLGRRLQAIEEALSVKPDAGDAAATQSGQHNDGGVSAAHEPADLATTPALDQTRVPTGESADVHSAATVAASGGAAAPLPPKTSLNRSPTTAKPPRATHFTRVERTDYDDLLSDTSSQNLFSVQTLALVLMLLALGAGIWYVLQPPSADALFARIESKAGSGDADRLVDAEDDIRTFLARHAHDPRSIKVEEYREQIELERLERKLELRARLTLGSDSLTPVERGYIEAIRYVRLDPERGREKLRALIDVYADKTADGGPTQQCLTLAERQLQKLNDQLQDFSAESLALVESRLDAADQLQSKDPQAARKIRQGVVELYGDKSWALPAVERARRALGESR